MRRKKSGYGARGERVHGEVDEPRERSFAAVYGWVRKIPKGRVMTYGQIAALLESRLSPRAVGWAMHGCPRGVPWHRVVNATGGCSTERLPDVPPGLQRALLEGEGVEFRAGGTIDLQRYRWTPPPVQKPPSRAAAAARGVSSMDPQGRTKRRR